MTTNPALHGAFTLTRDLSAPPAAVYAAFAEPALRARWFRLPGPSAAQRYELDFREGGGEVASNSFPIGDRVEELEYRSRFFDLVPGARIVYGHEAVVDGLRRWVSLTTVELAPTGDGTRLSWTEQYTFLMLTEADDDDPGEGEGSVDVAHLRGGTGLRINGLASLLDALAAEATVGR